MDYAVNPEAIVNAVVTSLVSKRYGNLTDRLWGKLLSRFPVLRADLAGMDFPSICTDGQGIYYSPEFIHNIYLDAKEENRLDTLADRIKFVLAHELMHIIYKNVAPNKKDITFAIPGPQDKAWEKLQQIANESTDAIINARLKKEFGTCIEGVTKRDENGNVIAKGKFCFYEGDVEKAWTQVFAETCAQVNKKMAEKLGIQVNIPDGYYDNIALFRELFNKMKKDQSQDQNQDGDKNKESSGSGGGSSQGSRQKPDNKQDNSGSGGGSTGSQTRSDDKSGGGSGQPMDDIDKIVEKILHGNSTIDDHEMLEKSDSRATKAKLDRVMREIKKEIERAGSSPGNTSVLISIAERYFRMKPEPWYVGISLLLKNKVNEGPQIRERITPTEMLTQVMTGNSVVQFDKKSRQMDIAFAVDTSGSMGDKEVIAGVLKILGYLERNIPKGSLGHKFIFCQIDAGIEEWQEMRIPSREYQQFKKSISSGGFRRSGYGGTRLAPFFEKIGQMKKKPDAVVLFSDMQLFDYPDVEKACDKFRNNIVWLASQTPPDEFYKHKVGRVYDASALIDEITIAR